MKDNGFKLAKERSSRYPAQTITDTDYGDDLALQANTPTQAETLLHSLEWTAAGIGLHVDTDKTEYMCFNQKGNISTLNGSSLKLVDKFPYQGNSISSTEKDINTQLAPRAFWLGHLAFVPDGWSKPRADSGPNRPPASAGQPLGGRAALLSPLSPMYGTRPSV